MSARDNDSTRPYRIGRCPQCGQSVRLDESNAWRPFCSERCKLLDLGEWFGGRYGIASDDQTPPGGDRQP